jgi:hypothetical protein
MELDLDGYQHLVFRDFRLLADEEGVWQGVYQKLQGSFVPDLERVRQEHQYHDLWDATVTLLEPERLHVLAGAFSASPPPTHARSLLSELSADFDCLASLLSNTIDSASTHSAAKGIDTLFAVLAPWLKQLDIRMPGKLLVKAWHGSRIEPGLGVPLLAWRLLQLLRETLGLQNDREWTSLLQRFGLDYAWHQSVEKRQQQTVVLALQLLDVSAKAAATDDAAFAKLLQEPVNQKFLGINNYQGTIWFNRERFTALATSIALRAALHQQLETCHSSEISEVAERLRRRLARAAAVGYQLEKFLLLG